ncbi:hypothetical protein BB558_003425 [Smittium angustum]|uniref:Uncharacterized protein n=1 Tax=Smittium angustum TaxID=133377 RepID=A0A2U1J655_SMIAN|nr:hypothetical protein BB558_003425 [Smittium angustum]
MKFDTKGFFIVAMVLLPGTFGVSVDHNVNKNDNGVNNIDSNEGVHMNYETNNDIGNLPKENFTPDKIFAKAIDYFVDDQIAELLEDKIEENEADPLELENNENEENDVIDPLELENNENEENEDIEPMEYGNENNGENEYLEPLGYENEDNEDVNISENQENEINQDKNQSPQSSDKKKTIVEDENGKTVFIKGKVAVGIKPPNGIETS